MMTESQINALAREYSEEEQKRAWDAWDRAYDDARGRGEDFRKAAKLAHEARMIALFGFVPEVTKRPDDVKAVWE